MGVTPDYQPYLGGPFRWRLGLRPLDPGAWVEIDDDYAADLRQKATLLDEHTDTVLSWLPGIEEEAGEVLSELLDHLTTHVPGLLQIDDRQVVNSRARQVHDRQALHPLDLAGRLVQEDLILMVERSGDLVVGGGTVCSPNRWDLPSKVGRSLAEVHAPVAQLNTQLGQPIGGFFERLRPGRGYWRLGWGLIDTDERYQPLDGTAPPRPPNPHPEDPDVADRLFLRVERETLRRFPRTGCVLFTIRTYVRPLRHLEHRPPDARRLAEALRALPQDVAAYKQTDRLAPPALAWLDRVAGSQPAQATVDAP